VKEIPEYVHHCLDLLRGVGAIEPRRMFGGWGIFRQGRMFALIADETLYLKVDDGNRAAFDAAALPPFTYAAKGSRRIALGYRQAPPDAMEDPLEMRPWARGAVDAALREPAPKPRDPARVAGALNLGPKSETWLAEAGIHTRDELRRVGAAAAYARVRRLRPREATRNLLHALHGALAGVRWDRIDGPTKARLDAEADAAIKRLEKKAKPRAGRRPAKR
jgi:DNA transformation protein